MARIILFYIYPNRLRIRDILPRRVLKNVVRGRTNAELGPTAPAAGAQYLRTEAGLSPEDAQRVYDAWANTYDPHACAEDCVDKYLEADDRPARAPENQNP